MPVQWNGTTDRKLLLSIIHLQGAATLKWDQVASLMGEGFTAESTRQHFQALRKKAEAEFGKMGTPSTTPAKGSPRKKKTTDATTPSKVGRKRKGTAEEDDAESDASPTKKQNVKAEAEEGTE